MIVQSSWKVSDGRAITDAVVFSESESVDLEDEIMVENCVMLEAPEKGDGVYPTVPACQLLISCEPPHQITRITVLCEARVLEVYGHHGEYLKTIKCMLLEEAEDMIVFRGDIELDVPLSLFSLKFVMLRSLGEMWLYGVKVHVVKAAFDDQNLTTIPISAVEKRLDQMGLTLSDKAEAFKQLVQNFQKSNRLEQGMSDILSSLLMSNLIKSKSPSPDNSSHIKTFLISPDKRDSQNNIQDRTQKTELPLIESVKKIPYMSNMSTSPLLFKNTSTSSQTDEEYINLENSLKSFIAEKVEDMDRKLWERIDRRFKETEAKILCKLEEIESFVKPQGILPS